MGKEDKLINYKEENELLRNEIEFLNSRINTLIKEVAANGETIKARDAKCKELVAASNKNAKTAKYYRDKLSAAVKMYEEEAYLVDQERKEESYKYDQAQDYIFELESIKDFFKNESHKMKESIKKYEKDREDSAMEISKLQNEIYGLKEELKKYKSFVLFDPARVSFLISKQEVLNKELEKYKIEVRRLNAACRRKNDLINKLYGALNYDGWSKMWEDNHE